MKSSDPRTTIIARRARFVAAALASAGLAASASSGCDSKGPPPGACLKVRVEPTEAKPCLEATALPPTVATAADGGTTTTRATATDAGKK